ncbi:MAG: PDGLE domain-containing protein [Candidatus Saganbacteria bacterium]|nr:PDGLE domain-containing protein [Candidatus Saganbacteria bacterium]
MNRNTVLVLLGISILIAVLATFFASTNPDGLEKVAENLGFSSRANK